MVNKTDQGILYGHYNNFESESEQYKLKTAVHCAGLNDLSTNTGMKFSTINQDNDEKEEVYLSALGSAWWHKSQDPTRWVITTIYMLFTIILNAFFCSILNSDFHRMFSGGY